ncbi:hypothetical protein [Streptomyces sp. NPDC005989]|uniref:hypothetical protein n=1 Tax=Streptomyces sp. NPDC005989 TaxID=3156727 RepID=UPI0033FAE273
MFTGYLIDTLYRTIPVSAAVFEGRPTAVKVLRAPDQNGLDQQTAAYALHHLTRVAIFRKRTTPPTTAPSASGHTDFQNCRSSPTNTVQGNRHRGLNGMLETGRHEIFGTALKLRGRYSEDDRTRSPRFLARAPDTKGRAVE